MTNLWFDGRFYGILKSVETYSPSKIEPKWQKVWREKEIYKASDPPTPGFLDSGSQRTRLPESSAQSRPKPKFYVLVEFPYPSGERLHVGHARSYSALDAVARYKRMKGYNVLYPFGWDAFGLPAENYAVKTGVHPRLTTKKNIEEARKQAVAWGLSFDWSREINTTDPQYYRWTQWIFLQLFRRGLAYRAEIPVNWCPSCKINLANEEVIDGDCERCRAKTEKRLQKQWMLAITKYADRLLKDLDLVDYEPRIKRQQVEWIGRKEGITIKFEIRNSKSEIGEGTPGVDGLDSGSRFVECFTTRPDTIFGATFVVLAPEHEFVEFARPRLANSVAKALDDYVTTTKSKSELERITEGHKKTGVFTGFYAVNPVNGRSMPIWVSDFVLASVGTGAVMGVPGHDKKDFEFAKEFSLPIERVVIGRDADVSPIERLEQVQEEEGRMVNSDFLNGLEIHPATGKMIDYLEEKGWGQRAVSYHLRDWVFSRQHYWGEPIPVVYCTACAKTMEISNFKFQISNSGGVDYAVVPVPEKDLPVELPFVENYKPTESGASPLAQVPEWVKTICPDCGGPAARETDTMPNWAGSSWYYLAYLFADKLGNTKSEIRSTKQIKNSTLENSKIVSDFDIRDSNFKDIFTVNKNVLDYWLPVDWYNGGMEHTTLHLLYSRFWHKFLYDLGLAPTSEPYAKRTSHGVVLGSDGSKMSKSKGNVINPDEIVQKFGADTLRLYEMFIGPFAEAVVWNMNGVAGVYRFLGRVYALFSKRIILVKDNPSQDSRVKILLSKLAKKVSSDLESMKFNTAVSGLMEFTNEISKNKLQMTNDDWNIFLRILAPMAPHLAEELWQKIQKIPDLTGKDPGSHWSIHQQPWPEMVAQEFEDEEIQIVVQVNGKVRDIVRSQKPEAGSQKFVEDLARSSPKVQKYLQAGEAKVIFVPGKIINFVTVRDQIPDLTDKDPGSLPTNDDRT